MDNGGKRCGKGCEKVVEKVREKLLKRRVLYCAGDKVAKKRGGFTLNLHKVCGDCEKELMNFKIIITESTIST